MRTRTRNTRIVPHQFRHTYATEMLRSGVSFPVLMKLLGHVNHDRHLELTGRGLPRKPVPEKVRTVAQSPGPPALPKLGLLTMRRNGPAVPLHGTRVEVLRGEWRPRGVSPLYILKPEQF